MKMLEKVYEDTRKNFMKMLERTYVEDLIT